VASFTGVARPRRRGGTSTPIEDIGISGLEKSLLFKLVRGRGRDTQESEMSQQNDSTPSKAKKKLDPATTLQNSSTNKYTSKSLDHAIPGGLTEPDTWSVLVPIKPNGTRPPLFVVSGLGGEVLHFSKLAYCLGDDQPLYALQPQGLDGRSPFLTSIEDMAAAYIREIRLLQPEGLYCLAGYSFGGTVAFEMAQQLLAKGQKVGLLAMLDALEWRCLEKVRHSLRPRGRLAIYKARLDHIFFEQGGWDYLKRRLEAKSAKVAHRLAKLMGRNLPQRTETLEEINLSANSAYQPKVYPGVLTVFRFTGPDAPQIDDEFLGWGGLAAGGVDVYIVPGTHHDITIEANVRVLAQLLRECLHRQSP
jgi:thioesterase domain-containing protein